MDEGFSGTQAATVVGITYRQLDYWARTDLIRPSLTDAAGSGSRRRYSYKDLLELRVIKTLLDSGIKLESVREVFDYLREHVDADIASAHLVINGSSVVLCQGDELIDVLAKGQGVLNVREVVVDQWRVLFLEAGEFLLHRLQFLVGHMVEIDEAGASAFHRPDQFIQFQGHDP